MGFLDSWKPFFGVSDNKTPKGKFDLYERSNTTKLRQGAIKNLNRLDRQKFMGMLKQEGMLNKQVSNRQLIDKMRLRKDPLRYRQRIKSQLLTHKPETGMSEEQRLKNVRLTTFDRIRDEAKFGENKPYSSGLAGNYNQGAKVSPTAERPGATRSESQDKPTTNTNIHLPV